MYLKEQEGISEVIFTNCKDQTSKGIKDVSFSEVYWIMFYDICVINLFSLYHQ